MMHYHQCPSTRPSMCYRFQVDYYMQFLVGQSCRQCQPSCTGISAARQTCPSLGQRRTCLSTRWCPQPHAFASAHGTVCTEHVECICIAALPSVQGQHFWQSLQIQVTVTSVHTGNWNGLPLVAVCTLSITVLCIDVQCEGDCENACVTASWSSLYSSDKWRLQLPGRILEGNFEDCKR